MWAPFAHAMRGTGSGALHPHARLTPQRSFSAPCGCCTSCAQTLFGVRDIDMAGGDAVDRCQCGRHCFQNASCGGVLLFNNACRCTSNFSTAGATPNRLHETTRLFLISVNEPLTRVRLAQFINAPVRVVQNQGAGYSRVTAQFCAHFEKRGQRQPPEAVPGPVDCEGEKRPDLTPKSRVSGFKDAPGIAFLDHT